ncbi:MAG: radical SAM (seleno)protein TrsS [Desulfovibrio sp.]|uniref:radical SAM (seleno)protein TrsS n=1 Tax=Desulfovibrio sp. 7SRBS1 TaxID=3378064 RepID=UPI003B3FBBAF
MLAATESVCPVCLRRIPAHRIRRGDDVFLVKTCPDHGHFEALFWRGKPDISSWSRPKIAHKPATQTPDGTACPFACGLCPEHNQRTCTALLEITSRCNLGCPICFASSDENGAEDDPDLDAVRFQLEAAMRATGGCNLQLSGGEPTVRDDLPEIIAMAREVGFTFVQVNTNGLRIAKEAKYARELAEAGLSSAFLQFDGVSDDVYRTIRGKDLWADKVRAVERLIDAGVGVVLVPTLRRGVNDHQLGDILRFALDNMPGVRGVHFQPMSFFGRYPEAPAADARFTLPEVMTGLETQTDGMVRADHFVPPGCEHSLCSFSARFLKGLDGCLQRLGQAASCQCKSNAEPAEATPALEGALHSIASTARQWDAPQKKDSCCEQDGDPFSRFINRAATHSFTISAMAFQDAWTLDLERLRGCCIHVVSPDGRLVPFCAWNLSAMDGRTPHRERANGR